MTTTASRGMQVPTYAYAANNPLRYVDLDGLKVNLSGIRGNENFWSAVWVGVALQSCPLVQQYFQDCFGADPWTDDADHELISLSSGTTPYATYGVNKSYLPPSVFGKNTLQADAELGATIAHELSHQMSLQTWDGLTWLGFSEPTGKSSANAFERLARCVLERGCRACDPSKCEQPQGVQFGPEMYR